jgi:hypothetical protein
MAELLTVDQVAAEVEALRHAGSPFGADALCRRVLRAIADDCCEDPAACAEAALVTCGFEDDERSDER